MLPHSHSEIEFMYFYNTSGCIYKSGGRDLTLHAGDMVAVGANVVHSCEQWGERCNAVCIIVDAKKLHMPLPTDRCLTECIRAEVDTAALFGELKRVLLCGEMSETEREYRISGLLYQLLAIAVKHSHPQKGKRTRVAELMDVVTYIEQNLSENLSVAKLAERMCLSVNRFYHVFREYTGMSPTEYITARRIEKACGYLADTDMTVAEIAQACHFCTSSYFCEKFRAYMKMTPLEYRRSPLTVFGQNSR
jgi:AraC-like DNA-binding protein